MIAKKLSAIPQQLYKYCSFKSGGHIKILRDQTFYFASPVTFNDVFDFVISIRDTPKMRKKYSKLLLDLNFDDTLFYVDPPYVKHKHNILSILDRYDPYTSPNLILQAIALKYKSSAKDKDTPTHFYQAYLAVTTGILCFSANYNNILMWSHYADEHSGFCIEFSTDYLLKLNADWIGKVSYSRERHLITTNDLDEEEKLVSIAFTKAIDWSYEEEYRIVSTKIRDRTIKFDKNAIRSIYLGCRSNIWRDNILRLRDKSFPHATIYQAKISGHMFGLTFKAL